MEIRRFKYVSGPPAPPEGLGSKRRRIRRCGSAAIYPVSGLDLDSSEEYKSKSDFSPPASSSSSSSSSPSREGQSPAGCPKYGVMAVCGRRRDMEDAISVRPAFAEESSGLHFFGVFDGHGCSHVSIKAPFKIFHVISLSNTIFAQVAESCKNRMHGLVAEELKRDVSDYSKLTEAEWKAAMERSFHRMDASVSGAGGEQSTNCRCEMQTRKSEHVGSTAVVAVVAPDCVVVSNCGDSRAVLCRGGVPIPLSSDHKVGTHQ